MRRFPTGDRAPGQWTETRWRGLERAQCGTRGAAGRASCIARPAALGPVGGTTAGILTLTPEWLPKPFRPRHDQFEGIAETFSR